MLPIIVPSKSEWKLCTKALTPATFKLVKVTRNRYNYKILRWIVILAYKSAYFDIWVRNVIPDINSRDTMLNAAHAGQKGVLLLLIGMKIVTCLCWQEPAFPGQLCGYLGTTPPSPFPSTPNLPFWHLLSWVYQPNVYLFVCIRVSVLLLLILLCFVSVLSMETQPSFLHE